MGALVWAAAGALVFVVARFVPPAPRRHVAGDLLAAMVLALLAGVAATALDFGGWREPDWRAAVFAALVAAAGVGLVRLRHE